MEDITEIPLNKTNGFIKHVFNFDTDTKKELLNIIQYGLTIIIPIIILNKSIKKYIPEVDEEKGSLEIALEVVGQMIVLFFGIYLIHRVATYFPTYSGSEYKELNMFNMIAGFLVIVLSLQTKLGEKVEILTKRGLEMVGIVEPEEEIEEKVVINVRHPVEVSNGTGPQMHQNSRADMQMKLNINDSIRNEMMQQQMPQVQQQMPSMQQSPAQQGIRTTDYDNMFSEPMAANESFGNYSAF